MSPPSHGVIVGQCHTEYLSVCRMACSEGFEAVGSVERKCDVSPSDVMVWTGSPLLCVGEYLQPPNYPTMFINQLISSLIRRIMLRSSTAHETWFTVAVI